MGVLPLQFKDGDTADSLHLSGEERFDISGLAGTEAPPHEVHVRAHSTQGKLTERSEEHTSELQSLMRISYAVFCLKKKKYHIRDSTDCNNPHTTKQHTQL